MRTIWLNVWGANYSPWWGARDLERKLNSFQDYYNRDRVHRGFDGAPANEQNEITDRKIARLDDYRWEKHCRGLHQLPVAA
jgi:putative transposase